MNDNMVYQQLRMANDLGYYKIISTGATTFSTAAYKIVGLTAKWSAKSMTNALCLNSTVLTSATTLSAGGELTGKITAITIMVGKAKAYIAKSAMFIG